MAEKTDKRRSVALFSLFGALYLIAFLTVENLVHSYGIPWILLCIPALLVWPAAVFTALYAKNTANPPKNPKNIRHILLSWGVWVLVSAYYIILNRYRWAAFPWSGIIAAALLWYPFSVMLAKNARAFSLFGFIWAMVFFAGLNAITTPEVIWAAYPIWAVFWWPLAVYIFGKKRRLDAKG